MSTGLECWYVEETPGKWYYVLQNRNCPVQCWDWLEYATAYGPFDSEQATTKHLHSNHANPGGHMMLRYSHDRPLRKALVELLREADKRKSSFGSGLSW